MNRMVHPHDYSSTLGQEEVKSEYLRSLLLAGIFFAILLIALLNYIVIERSLAEYYGGIQTFLKIITFILLFILYQLINIRFLRNKIRASQTIGIRYKVIHTTIEISFPSGIMLFIMYELQMLTFIDSPVVLTYFLLLILSVLHLDYRVNIFAGLFAAIQYACIIYYGFEYVVPATIYKTALPENSYYVRSVILALSGGAAAFVSAELKKRITSAFEFREAKNKVELIFGQQVSKEVSKALIEEAGLTKKLEATVMFLDIRNFTSFADSHSADEVIEYQNKFVSPVIDIINLHQGVVFQILGDGLMACFGAPVQNTLHADMAFQASINILKQVEKASNLKVIPPTKIGIGLHSGLVVTGNIGNEQRKQFSISGTPVIVASRIEQLNKKYNTEFLISGEVYKQIVPGKIVISHLGLEPIRGIEKGVEIYKITLQTQAP
ncbi:MAG: hypothetical protein C0490_01925 [Marivirga sp.]|nr:hypothetical protein [Marivirga sp.]